MWMQVRVLCFVGSCLVLGGCKRSGNEEAPRTVPESALRGVARTTYDSPAPTSAQLARKQRSEARIRQLGLPILDSLPVVEEETTLRSRSLKEVSDRCLANTFCAIKGETNDQATVDKLIDDFRVRAALSPDESAFVAKPRPAQQELVDFGWRYECTHVFMWALGYVPELNPPDRQSNPSEELAIVRGRGPDAFERDAKLRSLAELLDQNDLYYRLHWAAVDLRLKGAPNPKANEEIIGERHRALNWLIRYMDQAWDDVSTDT
jgi:hypothetical protein